MGISLPGQRSVHPDVVGTRRVPVMRCFVPWRIGRSTVVEWPGAFGRGVTVGMQLFIIIIIIIIIDDWKCAQRRSVFY